MDGKPLTKEGGPVPKGLTKRAFLRGCIKLGVGGGIAGR